MNKSLKILLTIFVVLQGLILIQPASAIVLLNDKEALKEMFPEADTIVMEQKTIDSVLITKIKDKLGGKLVLYQAGSESKKLEEDNEYQFYFGEKAGKKIGVALMETQPGKWGPVKYIIALDTLRKVKNLAVMMYVEKRGRPIARRNFLSQFIGKTNEDPILVGKDIRAISGATISSRATAFAVKKVIVFYESVFPTITENKN